MAEQNNRNLSSKIIYLIVFLVLSVPLIKGWRFTPARMTSAEKLFSVIDGLKLGQDQIVLFAMDFGPNSKAENFDQSSLLVEHLMRRRIPIAFYSLYAQATPFLEEIPRQVAAKLMREDPTQQWRYAKDWVNLGYQVQVLTIQQVANSKNIPETLKKDARGNSLSELDIFKNIKTLKQIPLFIQVTGLVGALEAYLQFLKSEDFRPNFVHGCTSITIPKAYIYLDSGQLLGLLEGIAGAAWYSELLTEKYPNRERDKAGSINTGLGFAQILILLLILLGNIFDFRKRVVHA